MFWFIGISLLLSAYTISRIPKPEGLPRPGINEIKAPTSAQGRPIPVLFGTRVIESPMVVWWGDIRLVAIRKKGGKK